MTTKFEYADKYARTIKDIPTTEHYAIFENESVFIPGDERSRTNPGHGYPESTQHYINYEVYLTREKWEAAIEYRMTDDPYHSKKNFIAAHVKPVSITTKITVKVET